MNKEELKRLQSVLFDMLCEIDKICSENNIRYFLFSGTLLGAVRHQGFIPWDDDLDIIMPREDYEQFLKIAPKYLDSSYFLQAEFSESWPMFFSKLRKNNTTLFERFIPNDKKMHQGIYLDIFPCDNLSNNRLVRHIQFASSKVAIAKSLAKRGYRTDSIRKKLFIQFCKVLPYQPFYQIATLKKRTDTKDVHSFFGASSSFSKSTYPRKWFTELTELAFNGRQFPCPLYYDALLKRLYGDYMKLPCESERYIKEHSVYIDFYHSYETHLEMQKNMKFDGYTRSIR